MFYSHEILTSRKYGVATVWLVATLGAKSNLKKVNRKAILDVDIPKACETILAPEAPMALRLQSNLLYGISRVYSQQCGYVLVDAQSAQNNIRALLRLVRPAQLDPEAGRSRPDLLILQDDPAFDLEFALPALGQTLSSLESSSSASRRSSNLSPKSSDTNYSSQLSVGPSGLGLVIPTSETGAVEVGGSNVPGRGFPLATFEAGNDAQPEPIKDEDGFLPYVDFEFDEDGNVHDVDAQERSAQVPGSMHGRTRFDSDSVASGQVRREHEAGRLGRDRALHIDNVNDVVMSDVADHLPDAPPFPEPGTTAVLSAQPPDQNPSLAPETEHRSSSDHARAPLPQIQRKAKVIAVDSMTELHRMELTSWAAGYILNMATASKTKLNKKLPHQAKKNADYWIYQAGIGNVGRGVGFAKLSGHLQVFAGAALRGLVGPAGDKIVGSKRAREDEDELVSVDGERRVRPREDEDQLGRGLDSMNHDSEMFRMFEDDGLEVGREALPELPDQSSAMPWNVSTSWQVSRPGSSNVRGRTTGPSSIAGHSAGAGRASSQHSINPGMLPRRASRMVSSSPLGGRDMSIGLGRLSSLELPDYDDEEGLLGGHEVGDAASVDRHELFGAATMANVQSMVQPPSTEETLDRESFNFLEFVKTRLLTYQRPTNPDEAGLVDEGHQHGSISFEELLLPADTSKTVAAHAFHHVLSLTTKSLLRVTQGQTYGDMKLTPVA